MTQIYKFGGASLKDAGRIRHVAEIVAARRTPLLIVVSAIGKTTNELESLTKSYVRQEDNVFDLFRNIRQKYDQLLSELFESTVLDEVSNEVNNLFVEIEWILEEEPMDGYDYLFDQIVSVGELISSRIVDAVLRQNGVESRWVDARNYIQTDNTFREASVNWEKSEMNVSSSLPQLLQREVIVTQGFIGSTSENFTTTLGREGSDYTAAIFASLLNAEGVVIWKDVPGVLNADPKWFDDTELINELSYLDAIELTYYGATVIHPKTIKPLQNKGIPLSVRSFLEYERPGTIIRREATALPVPSFIFKVNQVQIAILPKDFSFIVEDNFSHIFNLFAKHRLKINLMHNSAVRFLVSVDDEEDRIAALIKEIKREFDVEISRDLELITIRYYNESTINRVLIDKEVMVKLEDTYTCQLLVRPVKP